MIRWIRKKIMDTQSLNTPLKIWVKEDFRLPNFRPVPLRMHLGMEIK